MTNIHQATKHGVQSLKQSTEAHIETEILLCYVLSKPRSFLYAHPEFQMSESEWKSYQNLISQRLQGIPIAYLTGRRDFWSLSLKVNKHTLIPRHETELLVELCLKLVPNEPKVSVLDLGTGSGAIALALAKERPKWEITACDLSEEALQIAKENAQIIGLSNITFYQSNWFSKLPAKKYQVILSNPPYISEDDPHMDRGDLPFEPRGALVSSQKGLADLTQIILQAKNWMLPNGLLLLEHGYNQKQELLTLLKQLKYHKVSSWKDIQGQDRVCGGYS